MDKKPSTVKSDQDQLGPSLAEYPSERALAARARSGLKRRDFQPLINYLKSPYALQIAWADGLADLLQNSEIRTRKLGRPSSQDQVAAFFEAQTVAEFVAEQSIILGTRQRALGAAMREFGHGETWVTDRVTLYNKKRGAPIAKLIDESRKRHVAKVDLRNRLLAIDESPRPTRKSKIREK